MRLTMVMSQIALETSLACKGRGNGNFISLKSWNESFLFHLCIKRIQDMNMQKKLLFIFNKQHILKFQLHVLELSVFSRGNFSFDIFSFYSCRNDRKHRFWCTFLLHFSFYWPEVSGFGIYFLHWRLNHDNQASKPINLISLKKNLVFRSDFWHKVTEQYLYVVQCLN